MFRVLKRTKYLRFATDCNLQLTTNSTQSLSLVKAIMNSADVFNTSGMSECLQPLQLTMRPASLSKKDAVIVSVEFSLL